MPGGPSKRMTTRSKTNQNSNGNEAKSMEMTNVISPPATEAKVHEMIFTNPLLKTVANRLKKVEDDKQRLEEKCQQLETKIDALFNMLERERSKRVETKMTMGQMLSYQDKVIADIRKKVKDSEMEIFETRQSVREMVRDARLGALETNDQGAQESKNVGQTADVGNVVTASFEKIGPKGQLFSVTPTVHVNMTPSNQVGSNKRAKIANLQGKSGAASVMDGQAMYETIAQEACMNVNWDSFFSQMDK